MRFAKDARTTLRRSLAQRLCLSSVRPSALSRCQLRGAVSPDAERVGVQKRHALSTSNGRRQQVKFKLECGLISGIPDATNPVRNERKSLRAFTRNQYGVSIESKFRAILLRKQ
jgi:hypothetical protein